jgi:DNA polymerase V
MFAIADCNNFYASCEKLFNPSLKNRPVVVLSNNDGCVIARSAEVKKLGIPMGAPAFHLKEDIKKHNIAVFSTNFELYGDISSRVMKTLSKFSPDMEIYSIDEAFLSLDGFENLDLHAYGCEIRERVKQNTGIVVGVGIAPTKTLAKAANNYAKKAGNGVYKVESWEEIKTLLKWTAVEDVWGIGRKHCKKLALWNIKTAYDFITRMNEEWVLRFMTITGVRTWKELQGIPCLELELYPPSKKSIATTRSFGKMADSLLELEEAVSSFAVNCARKLRESNLSAQQILVFIRTNPFRDDLEKYNESKVITLPVASNDTLEIVGFALAALRSIFRGGYFYKKAGVVVQSLIPSDQVQQNLLDTIDRPKQKKLMGALDKLNLQFGKRSLQPASSGVGKKSWHMNQQKLSKRYTTKWSDIMEVKV